MTSTPDHSTRQSDVRLWEKTIARDRAMIEQQLALIEAYEADLGKANDAKDKAKKQTRESQDRVQKLDKEVHHVTNERDHITDGKDTIARERHTIASARERVHGEYSECRKELLRLRDILNRSNRRFNRVLAAAHYFGIVLPEAVHKGFEAWQHSTTLSKVLDEFLTLSK